MANKPKIPYPWDWYADKVQWMAMDRDEKIWLYTQKPEVDRQLQCHFCLDESDDEIMMSEHDSLYVSEKINDLNIPWHETLRRRPRRRKG